MKKASGSRGKVTLYSLSGLWLLAISRARSRLSACTMTLKRSAPLPASTETLTIWLPLPLLGSPADNLRPAASPDSLDRFRYGLITKAFTLGHNRRRRELLSSVSPVSGRISASLCDEPAHGSVSDLGRDHVAALELQVADLVICPLESGNDDAAARCSHHRFPHRRVKELNFCHFCHPAAVGILDFPPQRRAQCSYSSSLL